MIVNTGGLRVSWARALAAATAALTGLGLAVVVAGAPARAAEGLSFTWDVSDTFGSEFGQRTPAGATLTFDRGAGDYHPGSGQTFVSYRGSVAAEQAVLIPGLQKPKYGMTLADPQVTVGYTGRGHVSMMVSSWDDPNGDGIHDVTTAAKRVAVTTFAADAGSWSNASGVGTLAVTPTAWSPAFLAQLTPTVRGHFDGAKPTEFTAQATERTVDRPTLEARVMSADEDWTVVAVQGLGYEVVDRSRPISVGVAPAGASDYEGLRFVGRKKNNVYLAPPQTAFSTVVTLPSSGFDPRFGYSAYSFDGATWQSSRFDAEAPVSVPFKAMGFPRPSRVSLRLLKRPGVRTEGKVRVRVTGGELVPSGRLKVAWQKRRTVKTWSRKLNLQGTITQQLPPSRKGRWTLRVRYLGSPAYAPSGRRIAVRIGR